MATDEHQRSWLRGQRLKLLFVMLFALPLSGLYFRDFAVTYPRADWQLKSGRVIMRAMAPTVLGIKRPLLTVKMDGTDLGVFASLSANGISDMPQHVTFYYSGDPTREVRLEEETNPLWIALFLLIAPCFALWLIQRFSRVAPA